MSTDGERRADRALDVSLLNDAATLLTPKLRSKRDECRALEAELSYARRLLQGKIDILASELKRRAEGGEPGIDDLVGRLPAILAEEPHNRSGAQRLLDSELPANAGHFRREAERLATGLAQSENLAVGELAEIVEQLSEAERKVSEDRRLAQKIIDGLNAELVRRYRKGDEDPSALLSS